MNKNFLWYLILSISIIYIFAQSQKEGKEIYPFSFEELEKLQPIELQKPSFLAGSDGIKLAYYSYVPQEPSAIVILYHGAGLYSNHTYQWIGLELKKNYNIGCYLVDIRGHGYSGGIRGDTPTIEQVWNDVDKIVEYVRKSYPDAPLHLAGHSCGSGLLINYNAHGKNTNLVDGYIFLAPYLGPISGTLKDHIDPKVSFVKKFRAWVYILNNVVHWNYLQHINAVFFNYPSFLLKQDPLIVTSYSYAMSCATTPYEIGRLIEQVKKPFAIYIGQDDEQFLAEKVIEYKQEDSIAEIVPGAKHLSILNHAPELIVRSLEYFNAKD